MFGIGTGELLIFAVVLLLVVGPKRLPQFIKTVGKGLREVRQATTELRRQSGIDELMREDPIGLRALKNEINQPLAPRPKPVVKAAPHAVSTASSTASSNEALSAQDKAKETPSEGVDIAHAKLGESVNVTGSMPISGDRASTPIAPSVAAEKSPVQESEPTMLGVPLADPYALPSKKAAPVSVPPPPPPTPARSKPSRNKTITGQPAPRTRKISVPPVVPLSARTIKQAALSSPPTRTSAPPPPPVSPPSTRPASPSSAPRVSLPASIPPPSGESS